MRFLLDESAEFRIATHLKRPGHDVTAIAHDYPHALKDLDVLAIASGEVRILITNDRDFGELIFREARPHAGVILLRLGNTDGEDKARRLEAVLSQHAQDLGHFLVVGPQRVRVRRSEETR